nr:hypothetical protein Iba_chr13cCG8390 [Ipomoea batatas]
MDPTSKWHKCVGFGSFLSHNTIKFFWVWEIFWAVMNVSKERQHLPPFWYELTFKFNIFNSFSESKRQD